MAMSKFLYRTSEAKTALGCGTTTLYELINKGLLEARRLGHRTYITASSLEAFIASLPRVVTPTMARSEHEKWSGHRRPRPKPQENDQGIA
jgi:excisionase family DNA binding protein